MNRWKDIWNKVRKYVLNKYLITLFIAMLVFVFVGDQSLIRRFRRARQIRQTEERLEAARVEVEQARRTIEMLQDTDSLERYAREHYNMHADREDVYLIRE